MNEPSTALPKKRILFVDDEINVLMGLKRMARPLRQEWDVSIATSGQSALQLMGEEHFDVLVSDMRMPGMDGVMLLNEVSDIYPQIIRILLSGQCDLKAFIASACPAHQFLAKPCDAASLKTTIERAIALRKLLNNQRLRDIVMGLKTLPSPSTIYTKIDQALSKMDVSMQYIGSIIDEDIGMTAKLLQLVNSPFFGFSRTIKTPTQAATFLGVNTLQFIMLHLQVFNISNPTQEHRLEAISKHCMRVAFLARGIVELENGHASECSEAYIGGMMHDLGHLILAVNMPDQCKAIADDVIHSSQPTWQIEQQHLGASHAEIGAYLIGLWGLPEGIVDIVAYHHSPSDSEHRNSLALAAVHVADMMVHESESMLSKHVKIENITNEHSIDKQYLEQQGFLNQLASWKKYCVIMMEKSHE